jgi:hypothetical protein
MNDVKQGDYAEAARVRMCAKLKTVDPCDPIVEAIGDYLKVVANQWRSELGWKVEFKVKLHVSFSRVEIYHLSVRRIFSWWQLLDAPLDLYRYLGTIVFRTNGTDGGWTSPVGSPMDCNFKFETLAELPQSLEKFFSSPEVGQILVKLFGEVKPPEASGETG